jgi:hypothetical protein
MIAKHTAMPMFSRSGWVEVIQDDSKTDSEWENTRWHRIEIIQLF